MSDIPTELKKILKAPMRSEISTADIAIGMWSSTELAEKLVDLRVFIQNLVTKARIDEIDNLVVASGSYGVDRSYSRDETGFHVVDKSDVQERLDQLQATLKKGTSDE